MDNTFINNIGRAYTALEEKLNEGMKFVDPSSKNYKKFLKDNVVIVASTDIRSKDYIYQRVALNLGNGYVVKVNIEDSIAISEQQKKAFYLNVIEGSIIEGLKENKFEESNVELLLSKGFTKKNGFYVSHHKVVGVKIKEGKAHIDPEGEGLTITEDISEEGTYNILDIQPYHFAMLDNRKQFFQSYTKHLNKLLALCNDPNIIVDILRHGTPDNPEKPISKMLLLKEKDNIGEIVIGDLNNLEFKMK